MLSLRYCQTALRQCSRYSAALLSQSRTLATTPVSRQYYPDASRPWIDGHNMLRSEGDLRGSHTSEAWNNVFAVGTQQRREPEKPLDPEAVWQSNELSHVKTLSRPHNAYSGEEQHAMCVVVCVTGPGPAQDGAWPCTRVISLRPSRRSRAS